MYLLMSMFDDVICNMYRYIALYIYIFVYIYILYYICNACHSDKQYKNIIQDVCVLLGWTIHEPKSGRRSPFLVVK